MPNYGTILLTRPDGSEQDFALTAATVTLGRDASNDIAIPDQKVSRQHAQITCDEAGCVLIDLGSSNGLVVDGQRVERVALAAGTVVKLGNSTLRFEAQAPAEALPLASPAQAPAPPTAARTMLDQILLAFEQDAPAGEVSAAASALRNHLLESAQLVVHAPQTDWREVRLTDRETWTIGRNPECDIVIEHQKVSSQHACIDRRGDSFVIRDLGSTNGTWLGDRRVETHALQHADTLTIGNAQLVFKSYGKIDAERLAGPQATGRTPVIVVPGSFGSSLWRGAEQVWPSVRTVLSTPERLHYSDSDPLEVRGVVGEVVLLPKLFTIESYNRIGDYLENELRYTRGDDLLEFAYDWRADLRIAAQRLAEQVERWAVGRPITIIAHSMGCLVTRYYIDCLGGHSKVGRLLLIGGPNYGIAAGLTNALPTRLGDQLPATLALGGSLGRRFVEMLASFPASYQLLPAYPCIFDQHGQAIDLYQDDSWADADRRPLVQAARELHQRLNPRVSVPTVCIFGYGSPTISRIQVERDRQGTWQALKYINSTDGDGMVETKSAILQGAELHPVRQDHNTLYVDEDVLMRLRLELAG